MRIELDVSLRNPTETIDLIQVKNFLGGTNSYKMLHHQPNNYLTLKNIHESFKIRVHEDGRIYAKTEIDSGKDEYKNNLLKKLFKFLKDFICDTHILNPISLKNEISFGFYGSTAHSFFWEKYNELNQIGKEALITYDLRTYAQDDDSICVKLESFNPINIEMCFAGV